MKKRLLAALLTSALALSLTACGGGTDSSATDGGDTASTPVSYTHLDVYKRQALHCATSVPSGFSQNTCLPWFMAISICWQCRKEGETIMIASSSGFLHISSKSV